MNVRKVAFSLLHSVTNFSSREVDSNSIDVIENRSGDVRK